MFFVRLIAKKGLGYKQLGILAIVSVLLLFVGAVMDTPPAEESAVGNDIKEGSGIKESFNAGRKQGQEVASSKSAESKEINEPSGTQAPKKSKEEVQIKWNTNDIDVESNGNLLTAIALIGTEIDIKSKVKDVVPSAVMKSPWKYYGEVVGITGEVAIIQEYPPGSDMASIAGGDEVGELVLVTEDMTFVDYMHIGSTGVVSTGDIVTVYGYPVGIINADNKLGGQTQELCVVGNVIEMAE